jgi:hypothetical protein
VEAPVKLRSGEKVQYTAVSVGSSAQAATRKRNSGLERVASGSSGAVFVTGQASDSAKTTLPMTFSSEETYDNPAVASAAFKSGTDGFLPGSAYDMSGTSEPPHSPRAVSSDQYNTDVRNGLVDPMQVLHPSTFGVVALLWWGVNLSIAVALITTVVSQSSTESTWQLFPVY